MGEVLTINVKHSVIWGVIKSSHCVLGIFRVANIFLVFDFINKLNSTHPASVLCTL